MKSSISFPQSQFLAVFGLLSVLCCLLAAETAVAKTFTGRAGERCNPNDPNEPIGHPGDWNHPKNWGTPCDPVPPPGAGETATIPAGFTVHAGGLTLGELNLEGTLIVSGDCQIHELNITGNGQLLSSGDWRTITIGTVFNMEGDSIGAHTFLPPGTVMNWRKGMVWGDLTQSGGALLFITTDADHVINACTLHLNGVTTWNGSGRILQGGYFETTAKIINKGTFLVDGSGSIETEGSERRFTFENAEEGEFIKAGPGTVTTFTRAGRVMEFLNKGIINLQAGVFEFKEGQLSLRNGSIVEGEAGRLRSNGAVLYLPPEEIIGVTGTIELAGGYMEGNARIVGEGGTFHWTGGRIGTMQGTVESPRPATLTIPPGMTLSIRGDGEKRLGTYSSTCSPCHRQHGVIVNQGTAVWSGEGDLVAGHGSGHIINEGTFTVLNDRSLRTDGGDGHFTNRAGGTLRKQTAGTTTFDPGFGLTSSGVIDVAGGEVLVKSGLFLSDGSATTGAGRLISIGSLRVAGASTIAGEGTVELRADILRTGTEELGPEGTIKTTGNGKFEWTGGHVSGVLNIDTGSRFDILGPENKHLGYHHGPWDNAWGIIHNRGTITWTGTGSIIDVNTGRFFNESLFVVRSSASLGVNQFNNLSAGVLRREAGGEASVTEVVGPLNNSGTIDVASGEMLAKSWLFLDDGSVTTGAGRLASIGSLRVAGTSTIAGEGTVELRADILRTGNEELGPEGTLTTTGNGKFEWTGGYISGVLNIAPDCRFDILGPENKHLGYFYSGWDNAAGTINNRGTITWTGTGPIIDVNTGRFFNESLFVVKTSAALGANQFNNLSEGVLRKEAGGETAVTEVVGPLNNSGTIEVASGELLAKSWLLLDDGSVTTGAGRLASIGSLRVAGTATIAGEGTVELRADILRTGTEELGPEGTVKTTGNGKFEWTGGYISGVLNIAPDCRFDILGPENKHLGFYFAWNNNAPGTINNRGTITWTGPGGIIDHNTGHLYNIGSFNVRTDAPWQGRLHNTGILDIGAPSGSVNFAGAWFTLAPEGTLRTEIAGVSTPLGRINAASSITLGGRLEVRLAPGYQPAPGDAFPIINKATGTFTSVTEPANQAFRVAYAEGEAVTLTAIVATPRTEEEWREFFFPDNPNAPEAQTLADADHDGVPNLLEYALGLHPRQPNGSPIEAVDGPGSTVSVDGVSYLACRYRRPAGDFALSDIHYLPQRSTTFAEGSWSAEGVMEHSVVFDPETSTETVTVRSTHPRGPGAEFLCLAVTLTPS